MDTPEFMKLSAQQKAEGMALVRFLDQIILLNKAKKAQSRYFFASRNICKRNNREFGPFPVLLRNPPNAANCTNEMVTDRVPIRPCKAQVRLDSRIAAHNQMVSRSKSEGKEYTKPGSMKKAAA